MTDNNSLQAWVSLWRAPGIGCQAFHKLLAHFGDPTAVLNANSSQLEKAGLSRKQSDAITSISLDAAKPDMLWLEKEDHHLITFLDDDYPPLLKQISAAPPLLYVHGNTQLLSDPQIAIVGSRTPTPNGAHNAFEFAKHFANMGLCVTSGLAMGIDGEAHKGALADGGVTIAVTATGLDRVYPAKHRQLAYQIVEQGAMVSENPIGTTPRAQNFPRRNRIISGLSHGSLVVEAAQRSGSLITADYANEQGRMVFAIPGSIHNPLARGCHKLIRQGAKLVETANDVMEDLAGQIDLEILTQDTPKADANAAAETPEIERNDDNSRLLAAMGYEPVSIDQLVIQTGLTPASLSSMLLVMELQGLIASNGRGSYTRLGE
ncbi:DNA-processing protein DprA [Leucothrix arctica]|uniref:DNA-protecting protein DprA n=1 Tax=Leucothrix arctica TaxID=1481894 RepID=A0A317CMT0_9GAMM|nr:DNA-processing protein DprA [Leucothrix arctica]PWQ98763.1 DNA-protecting protein DprA [Leucothrix arctica]